MSLVDKIKKEMDNRNLKLFVLFIIIMQISTFLLMKSDLSFSKEIQVSNNTVSVSKIDSLQDVIKDLQIQIEISDRRYDEREKKYEEIIFEYEMGISHIEKYHNDAYRDFHRILAHHENYKREDEKENKKRLKINYEKSTKKGFY